MIKINSYPYLDRPSKRLKAGEIKVMRTKNGQFHVTIPKSIALRAGLEKGSIICFELSEEDIIIKINRTEEKVFNRLYL